MDKKLVEYKLDELEKACLNEHNATEEYRRRLEKELKKDNPNGFVNIKLDASHDVLQAVTFFEIKSETLKEFNKNNGLRLIIKSKTLQIDLNGPVYMYFFVSSKRKNVPNILVPDLTECNDDKVIFNLLDEKNDLK